MLALEPLKKYAQFTGRSRRAEFWQFTLAKCMVFFVFGIAIDLMGGKGPAADAMFILAMAIMLGLVVPDLAVGFRRLHDTERSAWWLLIACIPLVGAIVLLVFLAMDGTAGPNRFGPDPKNRAPGHPGAQPAAKKGRVQFNTVDSDGTGISFSDQAPMPGPD